MKAAENIPLTGLEEVAGDMMLRSLFREIDQLWQRIQGMAIFYSCSLSL